jgi:hypothetical protein
MVRGRLRTRQTVVNDPGRSVLGAVRRMVGHGLWLVVRRLPNLRRPPRGRILRAPYVTA